MRPTLTLLDTPLIERILAEASDLLGTIGVEIHNPAVLDLLAAHGARIDRAASRAFLDQALVDRAVESAPSGFQLYDVHGKETHDFDGRNVHFTPGSAAINILDGETGAIRALEEVDLGPSCPKDVETRALERIGDQDSVHRCSSSSRAAKSGIRSASRTSPMCPMRKVPAFHFP